MLAANFPLVICFIASLGMSFSCVKFLSESMYIDEGKEDVSL